MPRLSQKKAVGLCNAVCRCLSCIPSICPCMLTACILECINCLELNIPQRNITVLAVWKANSYILHQIALVDIVLCVCIWVAQTHRHPYLWGYLHECFPTTLNTCVYVCKKCLLQSEISSRSYRGYVGNLSSTNT